VSPGFDPFERRERDLFDALAAADRVDVSVSCKPLIVSANAQAIAGDSFAFEYDLIHPVLAGYQPRHGPNAML